MTREQRLQKLRVKRAKLIERLDRQRASHEAANGTERELVLVTAQVVKLELKVAA